MSAGPRTSRSTRDEDDRRDRGPDDLQPRVAVDRRAVELLLAGLHPIAPHAVQDDRDDEHEHRHGADDQDVVERVDLARLGAALRRPPVDQQAEGDPDDRRDQPDHQQLQEMRPLLPRRLVAARLLALRRHQLSRPMDAANYRSRTTEGTDSGPPGRGRALPGSGGERRGRRAMCAAGAELRRRDAVVAAERLGELRGLPVPTRCATSRIVSPRWASSSPARSMRTRVSWSRNVVFPTSENARCSWRREEATRRAMSSSERSSWYSWATIAVASS